MQCVILAGGFGTRMWPEARIIPKTLLPIAGTPFAAMPWTEAPRSLAAAVALCAEKDLSTGRTVDALVADANYVRRSDAELLWKDPRS